MLFVEMSSCTRKMYGGVSRFQQAQNRRKANMNTRNRILKAAKNKAAANAQASKSIVSKVTNLFSTAPAVETAVNKTMIAAENAQEAAIQMEQSIPTPAAASALVGETQTAVAQATVAANKSKNLLNLAKNVNAIANRLRSMTSTSGGRRRRRTHRRRN